MQKVSWKLDTSVSGLTRSLSIYTNALLPFSKQAVWGKISERTRRQMALDRGIEMERDVEGERE